MSSGENGGNGKNHEGGDKSNHSIPPVSAIKIYESIQQFDENLPKTVELITTKEGDKIYVIGTAHFSKKSQDDVSLVIRNTNPSAVLLELCPLRLHILQYDEETLLKEAMNLGPEKVQQILAEQGVTNGMFYLSFLKTNAQITKQLGVAPGGECRRAVAEAKNIKNCKVFLGDRPIDITLNRAMSGLTASQKLMLSVAMNGPETTMTESEVEKFKDRNAKPLKSMRENLPTVYNAFVMERDIILAHSLMLALKSTKAAAAKTVATSNQQRQSIAKIVGVVGMGHMNGILKNFGNTSHEQVAELMKPIKQSWFDKNFKNPNSTSKGNSNNTSSLVNWSLNTMKFWPKFKKFLRLK